MSSQPLQLNVQREAPKTTGFRGPGWWHLADLRLLPSRPRLWRISLLWLSGLVLSLATSLLNVEMGWNGIPISIFGIHLELTIYPPLIFSILAAIWLGPGWGLVPIYLSNLASALVSGMDWQLAMAFGLAGVVETGMLWGAMVIFQIDPDLKRWRDFAFFVAASLVSVASSSLAAITWNAAHGLESSKAHAIWRGWLIGDLVLIALVVLPLLRLAGPAVRPWIQRNFPTRPRHEFTYGSSVMALILSLAVLVGLVFLGVFQLAATVQLDAPGEAPGWLPPRLQEIFAVLGLLTLALLVATGLFGYALAHLGEQQRKLAAKDGLTGLWNRRAFEALFHVEAERSRRLGKGISLLFIDLDHFKSFNDLHGHDFGDQVLVEVSQRVLAALRETDHVFRWGGEEFVALLPHTCRSEAQLVAERVRERIAESPFGVGDRSAGAVATASVGAAVCENPPCDAASLVSAADQACYAAKAQGRNRVEVAASSVETPPTVPTFAP